MHLIENATDILLPKLACDNLFRLAALLAG